MNSWLNSSLWLLLVFGLSQATAFSAAILADAAGVTARKQAEDFRHPEGIELEKLLQTSVTSSAGEDLGKLTDLVLDLETGEIVFAILQNGGFLGIGGRLVPVPWNLVTLMSGNEVVAAVDADTIKSAPATDKRYARLENPIFVVAVRDFFAHGAMGGAESP